MILVGENLELDDPKLKDVIQTLELISRSSSGPLTPSISLLPHHSMAKWPLLKLFCDYDGNEKMMKATWEFIEPYITQHNRTLDTENMRDLMDLMLHQIKITTDKTSCFSGKSGKTCLIVIKC